jgi:hypothetical protein
MNKEQVIKVAQDYQKDLVDIGAEALRFPGDVNAPSSAQALDHVLWMCTEVQRFAQEDKLEKAMRWLGFIQGVLWALGEENIEKLKKDNYSEKT